MSAHTFHNYNMTMFINDGFFHVRNTFQKCLHASLMQIKYVLSLVCTHAVEAL